MFKKILSLFIVVTVISSSAMAGLDEAFSSLIPGGAVAVNDPGVYSSGSRTSISGGGVGLRVTKPSASPSLFSYTPPSWQAGCNGISAHFGGFSYISGAEFEQMLKSIASGAAVGFVSHLSLKTLCPACEAVVAFMKSQAQNASKMSLDSCKWGQDLAAKFSDGSGNQSSARSVCSSQISYSGESSGFLDAIDHQCSSIKDSIDKLYDSLSISPNSTAPADALAKQALACETGAGGNITWARLNSLVGRGSSSSGAGNYSEDEFTTKQVIMNLIGIEMGAATPASQGCRDEKNNNIATANSDSVSSFCAPKLDARDLMSFFMCGAPSSDGSFPGADASSVLGRQAIKTCSTYFGFQGTANNSTSATATALSKVATAKAWVCSDSDKDSCNTVKIGSASEVFKGTGFLMSVSKALNDGVTAIRSNEPLPVSVVNLMQEAPVPIYQILNVAAIYPSVANDLIASVSSIMAEQLAMSYFDELVKVVGKPNSDSVCLTKVTANQILDLLGAARAAASARSETMGQNLVMQEAIAADIRNINLVIQKQVMTQDLISNTQMSQAINQSIVTGTDVGSVESSAP